MLPTWYPSPEDPVSGVFVRDQAQAIAEHHDVAVLVLEPRGPRGDRKVEVSVEAEDGLLTVRVRAAHGRLRKAWLTLGLIKGVRRLRSVGFRPDLVHGHVFRVGAVAVVLGRAMGLPVVVSEHHSLFPRRIATRLDLMLARLAFRGAEIVAPVSESLRQAIEAYGIRARYRVVPNPVDTRVFHPAEVGASRDGGTPHLLFVGRLVAVKGLPRLLHALAGMAARGRPFQLEVIGEGPERGEYQQLAERLSLADQVLFRGNRPRTDVAELMRKADLCVMASDWETLSCVLLEAQASGLPAVAPAVGGIPEALAAGGGLLVPPHDVDALARGIEEALDRPDQFDRPEMARAIRARFGTRAVADRWDEVYSEAQRLARRRMGVRLRAARTR